LNLNPVVALNPFVTPNRAVILRARVLLRGPKDLGLLRCRASALRRRRRQLPGRENRRASLDRTAKSLPWAKSKGRLSPH